jgi:hypothetical protein
MSFAELQRDERDEAEFRQEADRRMRAMDEGKKVTMEEFEARHAALRAQGR